MMTLVLFRVALGPVHEGREEPVTARVHPDRPVHFVHVYLGHPEAVGRDPAGSGTVTVVGLHLGPDHHGEAPPGDVREEVLYRLAIVRIGTGPMVQRED